MKKIVLILFSAIGASSLFHPAGAQTGTGAPGVSEVGGSAGTQALRFRILALKDNIESELYYRTKTAYEPLQFPYRRPSAPNTAILSPEGQLLIYKRVEHPEMGVIYTVADQVAVPRGSRQVLVLATQLDDRIVVKAVEDNLSSNDRDWLFINASPMPLAVQVGKNSKPLPLAPGVSTFHRPSVKSGTGAVITVAARRDAGWERAYSTIWPIYEGQRNLVLFMEDAGELQVRNFFEVVNAPTI